MNHASYCIADKVIFGSYPYDREKLQSLLDEGVNIFVDLTTSEEKNKRSLYPYHLELSERNTLISFPIEDLGIPKDLELFNETIDTLSKIIHGNNQDKIYIHCRGGHGRAGVIVACLMAKYYSIDSKEAIKLTNEYHQKRPIMKSRWRKLGSPQTKIQKRFVSTFVDG